MAMVICEAVLKSSSPISFSAPIQSEKMTGETGDAFEQRTWRERLHVNELGNVFIPPNALKNCLSEVAKYLAEPIKGKGKSTYTKHFEAGLMVMDPIDLGIKGDSVAGERLFVPADGKRGGGKRVWRTFPIVPEWRATARLYLLDQVLIDSPDKVREYLEQAGKFIGLGRFRPRNNGWYGRFTVEKWTAKKAEN